jgi:polysaccharide export outer membrane protein
MIRILISLLLAAAANSFSSAAQAEPIPAPLLKYVREARRAGLNESQIQKEAQRAGWPLETVTQAIAEARAPGKEENVSPPAETTAPKAPVKPAEATPVKAAPAVSHNDPAAGGPEPPMRSPNARGVTDDYVIGAGDTIGISVWREPEVSVPNTVVRADGKVSMPLLKEVSVAGLTPAEAEKLITVELTKFLTAPEVTVLVTGTQSKKVYVIGAVKKEGPIAYTYRMTILQALSEAGGLTDYAKRKSIYVLHTENGRQFRFPFDYEAVLRGQKMEANLYLTPGDTIVVPH